MQCLLVLGWKRPREESLQRAIADHRARVGERCVLPAVTADVEERSEIVNEVAGRLCGESVGVRARGERIDAGFELLDPSGQKQILPGCLRGDHGQFAHLRCA